MDDRDLALVAEAFDKLLTVVGRECDFRTVQTVHGAKEDVLAILKGEWQEDAAETDEPEAADVERCPACNQSLWEIGQSYFACPTCYETFGDEATKAATLPF